MIDFSDNYLLKAQNQSQGLIEGGKDQTAYQITGQNIENHEGDQHNISHSQNPNFVRGRNSRQMNIQTIQPIYGTPQNGNNSLTQINFGQSSMKEIPINKNANPPRNRHHTVQEKPPSKFIQMLKVKLFANKLLNSTHSRKLTENTNIKYRLSIIDDKSTFFQPLKNQLTVGEQQPSLIFNSTKAKIKQAYCSFNLKKYIETSGIITKFLERLNQIPVLSPSGNFKFFWDIVMMVVVVAYLFMIPIEITFSLSLKTLFPFKLLLFCNVALIMDFILQWNFGYFDKGLPNMDRLQVMKKYFRLQVYLDLASSFFLVLNFFQHIDTVNKFHLLFFLRFKSAKLFFKKIEERYNLNPFVKQLSSLIQLLLLIVTVAHIIGCVWLTVAIYEENSGMTTWKSKLKNDDWVTDYIYAYYFSTVTMITVGFGDIVPTNTTEMVVCVMTMLSSCGVFAYTINAIGTIFNSINQKHTDKVNNLFSISSYMAKKNINFDLQIQIKEYLEYYWDMLYTRDVEQESNLISKLSPILKEKLLYETFKMIIKDYPIFKNNFSDEFMQNLISIIEECSYRPEELIVSESIDEDHCIFFIETGKVMLFLDEEGKKSIKHLKPGQWFGDYSFFTGQSKFLNVKAVEFTSVFKIKRQQFLSLVQKKPTDHEIFCHIQDTLLYSKNFDIIKQKCPFCGESHLLKNCKQIFPVFNRLRVVNIHNKSEQQKRGFPNQKKNINKYPTFVQLDNFSTRISQFITDYAQQLDYHYNKYVAKDDEDDEEDEEESSFNIYSQQEISEVEKTPEIKFPGAKQPSITSQLSIKQKSLKQVQEDDLYSPPPKSPSGQQLGLRSRRSNVLGAGDQLLISLKRVQSSPNQMNDNTPTPSNDSLTPKRKGLIKVQQIQTNFRNSNFAEQPQQQHIQEMLSPQRNIDSPLRLPTQKQRLSNYQQYRADTPYQREITSQTSNIKNPTTFPIDQGKYNELAELFQQLIGMNRAVPPQKDKNDEDEEFEIQKNFENYLPHNNLSYIIEYFKFKDRYLKQLKNQRRHNYSIKNISLNNDPISHQNNIHYQKNAYLCQYPYNTPSCNRDFQILRVFEKKVQQQNMKKKQKLSIVQNSQKYIKKQSATSPEKLHNKGSFVSTPLQRLLERYQCQDDQVDNQTNAASLVNIHMQNNMGYQQNVNNSANINQSQQVDDSEQDLSAYLKKSNRTNLITNKPLHKQSTFFNLSNNNNNCLSVNNDTNNTPKHESVSQDDNSISQQLNIQKRQSILNFKFRNSLTPDQFVPQTFFNFSAKHTNSSQKERGDEEVEEILSADIPNFNRIHSTHIISPKDQYFTEDSEVLSQRTTIQQELQLNQIMKNVKSNHTKQSLFSKNNNNTELSNSSNLE